MVAYAGASLVRTEPTNGRVTVLGLQSTTSNVKESSSQRRKKDGGLLLGDDGGVCYYGMV